MIVGTWLTRATHQLEKASVTTARLDCLILLEDTLGKDRTQVLANPDLELTNEQENLLNKQIARRSKHEPLAYIRGKSEFFGREFLVNEHTLEPRPETETMIDLLKQIVKGDTVVDVGTGSGCIAITAKIELPHLQIIATDIDATCLEAAQKNAEKHHIDVTFRRGNLLKPLAETHIDILLCNLPYVPAKYELNQAATFEPKHAIFGGEDGLDYYRQLFDQVSNRAEKPLWILTESLPFQHEELATIAAQCTYKLAQTEDFIQVFELS